MGRRILQEIGKGPRAVLLGTLCVALAGPPVWAQPNPVLGKVFKKDAGSRSISIETTQLRVDDIYITDQTVIRGRGESRMGFADIPVGARVEVSWKKDFDDRMVAEWIRVGF